MGFNLFLELFVSLFLGINVLLHFSRVDLGILCFCPKFVVRGITLLLNGAIMALRISGLSHVFLLLSSSIQNYALTTVDLFDLFLWGFPRHNDIVLPPL